MIRRIRFLCCITFMICGCGGSEGGTPEYVPSVVFDIDGTLTVGTGFIDFFIARPDAARALQIYVDKGYGVITLTARPELVRRVTEDWLRMNGFPEVPLYMSEPFLTDDDKTEEYKLTTLRQLMEQEQRAFLYGYGDSTTDFNAYHRASIPVDHTFALLRRGDPTCQEGQYENCLSDYTEHLTYIEEQPDVK